VSQHGGMSDCNLYARLHGGISDCLDASQMAGCILDCMDAIQLRGLMSDRVEACHTARIHARLNCTCRMYECQSKCMDTSQTT
jgi:hypothetical protein